MSSLENQPSETALGTVTLRFLAVFDEREAIRGHDHLAEIFIPEERRGALKDPHMRKWILENRVRPGMYEYMVARTAFFDGLVRNALNRNIPQIVFLGAGYDSRSFRFRDLIQDTRLFELDIATTQGQKKELLARADIVIPEQVAFVPINFNKDDLGAVLANAGFDRQRETLFVWEGVIYYLPEEVVKGTLASVKANAPAGSIIGFDYARVLPAASGGDDAEKIRDYMKSKYKAEPIQFVVRDESIEGLLSQQGYKIISHLTANEMEKAYLSLPDGSLAGNVPARFCLVEAVVAGKLA